jgi:hypothetical protein
MPLSSVVGAQSIVKPGVCTSSTRPASPYDGQVIYETDTDKALVWDGSAWDILSDMGAWTTWTPTITAGSGTFTTVSGTGRYNQMGKTVNGNYTITITTNGTAAGDVRFTLPVTAFSGINTVIGSGFESAASGTMNQIALFSSTQAYIVTYIYGYPGANGYTLRGTFTYEAA